MLRLFRPLSLQVSRPLLTARYQLATMRSAAVDDSRRCCATSKRSGQRCKRLAIPHGTVCVIHGGASRAVRAAAERRRAEAAATAMLNAIWDPNAEPITDAVSALQAHAGRMENAIRVLGARLDVEGVDLDSAVGVAWARVIRELRLALEGMERLGLSRRAVELAEEEAGVLAGVVRAILARLQLSEEQQQLVPIVVPEEFRRVVEAEVVRGELL